MIVQQVRAIRYKRFLTQAELAELAEGSLPVIQRMERGGDVRFTSIRAVADALGIEPSELVEEYQS